MNQIEIRYMILEDLYDQAVKQGRFHSKVSASLSEKLNMESVPEKTYLFNLHYLEGKGYIDVTWVDNGMAATLGITSLGCDLVEFYKLGMSMEQGGKGPRFETFLKQIADSGIKVFEGSAIGIVNIALSKLLG